MKKLMLIAICVMPFLQAGSEFHSSLELMKVFTDPSQKADKDFGYWIEQLRHHVTHKVRFSVFESHLRECLKEGAAQSAFHVFSTHRNLFHPALQVELYKIGLPKIKVAFNERLAQHKRLIDARQARSAHFFLDLWKILQDAQPNVEPKALHDEQLQRYRLIAIGLLRTHWLALKDMPSPAEEAPLSSPSEAL